MKIDELGENDTAEVVWKLAADVNNKHAIDPN
jgi:hypothetical protein